MLLAETFVTLGVARPTTQHVLYIQDLDGTVVRWNHAEGTVAGKESLQRQSDNIFNPSWITTEDLPSVEAL